MELEGEGVSQMSMLLHKPYLVKWSTKGGGGSKISKKTVHMVYGCPFNMKSIYVFKKSPNFCPHGLWMTPCALADLENAQ